MAKQVSTDRVYIRFRKTKHYTGPLLAHLSVFHVQYALGDLEARPQTSIMSARFAMFIDTARISK